MSVIVVGAGPTGLMLAGDLAMAGVPVKILERRAEQSNLTRAFGVHARTLELLDMRGLAAELVGQGIQIPEVRPHMGRHTLRLDLRHPESRFPYVLIVQQARTEALLAERVRRLGVPIMYGAEVTGLRQDPDGGPVTLTLAGGATETADYVAGCDGAHSAVRRLLRVGFSGRSYDTHILLADVRLARDLPPAVGGYLGRDGALVLPPFGDGWSRAVIWDRTRQHVPLDEPLGAAEVGDSIRRICGQDLGIREMRWSTRFLSERRQADRYRVGRVFLAGDAAHVHSPLGALGMNTGIQDAANLAWKLAAAHQGWAPPWLLDSYERERHPVGRTALRITDTLQRLAVAPAPVRAVRPYVARALLRLPFVAGGIRRTLSGLGIAYPTPGPRPAGRRVPDLALPVGGERVRLHELARGAGGRFLLIDATGPAGGPAVDDAGADRRAAARAWKDRVETVETDEAPVPWATTLLVRPDGYLAWSGRDPGAERVRAALRHWCGQPG